MMIRRAGILLVATTIACGSGIPDQPGTRLNALFESERIFVILPIAGSSDSLRLYTDTGGGLFVFGHAADRLGFGDSSSVVLSAVVDWPGFPDPLGVPDQRVTLFRTNSPNRPEYDGLLGQAWFADRVWRIDYPQHELALLGRPDSLGTQVPLWFMSDSAGARLLSFPRIQVTVDGEVFDLLLDTGATAQLTDSALGRLGDIGSRARATSFITTEVFERWREQHPSWRLLMDADSTIHGMDMIEVPQIEIGGHRVGPVWFTQRRNADFHEYMSQWMDRTLDGALGGNALRHFVVTIDYPGSAAWLRRVEAS